MKQSRKTNILILGMSLFTGVGIFGSTAGTLAWYAFNTRSSLSFTGTSISSTVMFDIGIVDEYNYFNDDDELADLSLERGDPDKQDGNNIVWGKTSDAMKSNVISTYLSRSSFATTRLAPVTSKARLLTETSDLTLYAAPKHNTLVNNQGVANEKDYVQIPFAFKIKDSNGNNLANKEIWLTDTSVQATGQFVDEAVRIFVNNSHYKFILNPSIKTGTETGATKVGGLLDLNGDKKYDIVEGGTNEFIYGEYSGTPVYSENPYGTDWDHAEFDNVNGVDTERDNSPSTFYAKHDAVAHTVSGVTFDKVAEYETVATVKPKINGSTGNFEEGKPFAYTDSADHIGYCTLKIYIEGWDHAVIDKANNYSFNLELKFEVNRTNS